MLTLARHIQERIQIGDTIVLTVLAIGRDTVRLGIAAPPEVPIWRAELPPERRVPPPGRAAKNAAKNRNSQGLAGK